MAGLSLADLEFFDTRESGETVNVDAQESVGVEDDDGFGDFIEYEETAKVQSDLIGLSNSVPNPLVSQPNTQVPPSSDQVPPPSRYRVPIKPSSPKPDFNLINFSDIPVSADTTTTPSIQNQLSDLSSFTPNIKFGQHLEKQSGSFVPTKSASLDQWNNILSALPGPSPTMTTVPETSPIEATISTASPPVPTHTPAPALTTLPPTSLSPSSLPPSSPDFDDFDDFSTFSSPSNIPPPNQLIAYFHSNIITVLNKFFDDLVPLSYTLKKRTIARPETKLFLTGFFEVMRISSRIMTGRARTSINQTQLNHADRESKELVRIWKEELSGRLKALLPPSMVSEIPQLDYKLTVSSKSIPGKEYCKICGLSKTELVKGLPRPEWDDNLQGHKSCMAFWDNRSTFGIE